MKDGSDVLMPGLLWLAADWGTAALIVSQFVQPTKFLLNYAIDPAGPYQNFWVRLYVYLLSIGIVALITVAQGALTSLLVGISVVETGGVVASLAILEFHVLTTDTMPTIPFLPKPKPEA